MTAIQIKLKGIFTRWGILTVFAVVSLLWFIIPVQKANAETETWKGSNYVTKFEAMPTLITPGHFIGIFERQGEVVLGNGEKAKTDLRGTVDLNMDIGEGTFHGYSFSTYEDGSMTITKLEGVIRVLPGQRLPITEGTGTYIKGTGRFQGIEGTTSFKSRQTKPYGGEYKGDAGSEGINTFTLPTK